MLLFGAGAGDQKPSPVAPPAPVKKVAAAVQKPPSAVLEHAAAPAVSSQPAYRRYVHPQAKAMAGIDLTRISSSPLGKKFAAQLDGLGVKQKASAEGMDFVSDIEKVVFSSPGEAGSKEGKSKLSEDAPFLVAMQGRFKIDKIRKSLVARKAARHIYQNAELWAPPQKETALAIVNSQVLLLGDVKSIRATLDAHAAGGVDEDENPVAERATELAAQYDLWLVSDASLEGFSGAAPVPQAEMLKGVDQFELGVSLRQGLKADISLHGRTPEETSQLGTMLAGLKALAALTTQDKKEPELAALLDKLKIGTEGERVIVSVQFSQKEIESAIATRLAAKPGQPVKATPVAAPAPTAPLVVKIYNAEGGDREFPLNR